MIGNGAIIMAQASAHLAIAAPHMGEGRGMAMAVKGG